MLGLITKSLSHEAEKTGSIFGFNDDSDRLDIDDGERIDIEHDVNQDNHACLSVNSTLSRPGRLLDTKDAPEASGQEIEDLLDSDDSLHMSDRILVHVTKPVSPLKSALRRKEHILPQRNVSWSSEISNDSSTSASLSVRRRALKQLQALCNYVLTSSGGEQKDGGLIGDMHPSPPPPSMVQNQDSMCECIRMAELLPAQNLSDLRQLLYLLPGVPPWPFVTYPLAMDVSEIVDAVGTFEPEFRWIHVQLNFVFSYLPGIQLRQMMLKIIEHQSPQTPIPGFFIPALCPYKPPPLLLPPLPTSTRTPFGAAYICSSPDPNLQSVPVVKVHQPSCWRDALIAISLANTKYSIIRQLAAKAQLTLDAYITKTSQVTF